MKLFITSIILFFLICYTVGIKNHYANSEEKIHVTDTIYIKVEQVSFTGKSIDEIRYADSTYVTKLYKAYKELNKTVDKLFNDRAILNTKIQQLQSSTSSSPSPSRREKSLEEKIYDIAYEAACNTQNN